MVCTWTPLPMVVLVFGQESIPLQEIDQGWSVNYGLWIRAVVLIGIVTYGVVVQGIYLIDDFTVTVRQMILLVASVPIAVVGFSMVIAAFIVFPIPFYAIVMIPGFFLALFLALRIVVGSQAIQQMIDHSDQNIILHFAKSLEDMIPVEVIFTADFFNAVYVATCMQSATSVAAVTAITVTDLSQTMTFETLFTTECLIVTAYLEAFMPLFYCSYMMVMVNLQSAQYHTEMKGITRDNVVATILPLFVFGLLQIASFVLLVAMIKWNCGMQAIYQLAFVLENQRSLVQCKMMLWMVVTLCFRVQHFGVDFKFEFIRLGFPKIWTPHG
eukprot:jgi/Phyca11/11896/fgenesh1_pm.PHYCAscaffold_86_\